MKKTILGILFTGGTFCGSAQSQHKGISYGLNTGMSLFNMTKTYKGEYLAGFTGGIYASIPIAKQLYIQPELNYQMQGTKYTSIFNGRPSEETKFRTNYINLPVLLKYNFSQTNFSAYVGPQLGYLTASKFIVDDKRADEKGITRKTSFAGVYGVEYYFPINKVNTITINARYTTGFSNVLKSDYTSDDFNGKHKGFTFTVGLRF